MSKKQVGILLIRLLQVVSAVLTGYYFALHGLLNRGQGGHGDEQLVLSFFLFTLGLLGAVVVFVLGPRGRSFWRTTRDFVVELCIVFIATGLSCFFISWLSLGVLRDHFCSRSMLERHPLSMLSCNCGADCEM
jgi:hypothetical protein